MTITAGLDVGGAHLKVALTENGRVLAATQFRCRLWMGMDKLDTALRKAAPLLARASRFAVTMTGELSDLFPDRQTGVLTLIDRIIAETGAETAFWMGPRGFGAADAARVHPSDVGSTNFLASATLAARHHGDALFIDFGSTTADIIPIREGRPVPAGLTDGARQANGELVYSGHTRTAVMGVTQRVPIGGVWVGLAREYLATMSDVRRILGTLDEASDLHAAADGKGKSVEESIARLARMAGQDAHEASFETWKLAAAYIREEQLRSLHDGALLVLSRATLPEGAPVIVAGTGSGEIIELARRLNRAPIPFADLFACAPEAQEGATYYAPAVAVALLRGASA